MTNYISAASENLNATGSSDARQVSNFAFQHLKAAKTFCGRAVELECASVGKEFGPFFEDIRSYTSGTILGAAASLEALINEMFISHNCRLRPSIVNFENQFWGDGKKNRHGIEGEPILKKYELALIKLDALPLDTNSLKYTNVEALVGLRNALIQYKPNWDPDRPKKVALVEVLSGRYALSPFVDSRHDFVTMQSMSAGCAIWAVDSVLKFLREFDARYNLDPDKMSSFWKLES